jgi:chromate reductase, NAD(P)H dehydrogenase (quinone)
MSLSSILRSYGVSELRVIRLLAISGSLRAVSSSTTVLRVASALAPPNVEVEVYEGIGSLPHFNPDDEDPLPAPVADFRAHIQRAEGLVICSPEYAHGVPGSLGIRSRLSHGR